MSVISIMNDVLTSPPPSLHRFVVSTLSIHVVTLSLLVALQLRPALEAELTAGAAERPVAAVLPAVSDEVGALTESFTAHLAHMWFLTWGRTRKRQEDKSTLLHCFRVAEYP